MYVIVRTVSGQDFTSDVTSKEDLLEGAGSQEKVDEFMEQLYGMAAHIKELGSFSVVIDGVKTYFNPDNIEVIQVFE